MKIEIPKTVSEVWEYDFEPASKAYGEHMWCRSNVFHVHRFDGLWHYDGASPRLPEQARKACELLWWARKTLGKDEIRTTGILFQLRNPTFDGFEYLAPINGTVFSVDKLRSNLWHPSTQEIILAWHRANYVLEDDEWYSPDGPAKMRDDQVRDGDGNALVMSTDGRRVRFGNYSWEPGDEHSSRPSNPECVPGQRARIEAFLARNVKATKPRCRIADSDNDSIELELSGPLQLGQLTATSQDEGHSVSVLLTPSDLRKLAETATKIADRIEGKPAGRPVPIE